MKLDDTIINIIHKYYNDNLPSIIHLYENGLCITQNLNDKSNMSIFIKKSLIKKFNYKKSISVYNLNGIDGIKEINFNGVKAHNCNLCKNLLDLNLYEIVIDNNILEQLELSFPNILNSEIFNIKMLLGDMINGIIVKIEDNKINILINILISI